MSNKCILHLPFNFDYFYIGTRSVDDFRRAIREDEQKMKRAINERLLYIEMYGERLLYQNSKGSNCNTFFPDIRYFSVTLRASDSNCSKIISTAIYYELPHITSMAYLTGKESRIRPCNSTTDA